MSFSRFVIASLLAAAVGSVAPLASASPPTPTPTPTRMRTPSRAVARAASPPPAIFAFAAPRVQVRSSALQSGVWPKGVRPSLRLAFNSDRTLATATVMVNGLGPAGFPSERHALATAAFKVTHLADGEWLSGVSVAGRSVWQRVPAPLAPTPTRATP